MPSWAVECARGWKKRPCGDPLFVRAIGGFLGLLLGTLLFLYGLFLILYKGEEGSEGDTYFDFGNMRVDADLVGIPIVVLSVAIVGLSLRSLRRSRIP
jgi:hypothetical protein